MTTTADDKTLERAMSDYLSVSRSAHLYDPADYARAEAEAWERLQAIRESLDSGAVPA